MTERPQATSAEITASYERSYEMGRHIQREFSLLYRREKRRGQLNLLSLPTFDIEDGKIGLSWQNDEMIRVVTAAAWDDHVEIEGVAFKWETDKREDGSKTSKIFDKRPDKISVAFSTNPTKEQKDDLKRALSQTVQSLKTVTREDLILGTILEVPAGYDEAEKRFGAQLVLPEEIRPKIVYSRDPLPSVEN